MSAQQEPKHDADRSSQPSASIPDSLLESALLEVGETEVILDDDGNSIALGEISELDRLLRAGFETTVRATPDLDDERLDDLIDSLRETPDFSVSRRMRRSVRTMLWLSALLLSVVGAYAFVWLWLRATQG